MVDFSLIYHTLYLSILDDEQVIPVVQKKAPASPQSSIDSLEVKPSWPESTSPASLRSSEKLGLQLSKCISTNLAPPSTSIKSLVSPPSAKTESTSLGKRTSHISLDSPQSKPKMSSEFHSKNLFYTPGKPNEQQKTSILGDQPSASIGSKQQQQMHSSSITTNHQPSDLPQPSQQSSKPPLRKTSSNDPAILSRTSSTPVNTHDSNVMYVINYIITSVSVTDPWLYHCLLAFTGVLRQRAHQPLIRAPVPHQLKLKTIPTSLFSLG